YFALDPIDPRQQPTELSGDNGRIAEGTDAGDIDVDRCAAIGAGLRGDRPRLTGRHRRRTLEDPVFGPIPGIPVAADDPRARIEVVVGRDCIESNRYRVEAAVRERAGHDRAGEAQPVERIAPALRPIRINLRLLLFPDQRGHYPLTQRRLEGGPGLEHGEEEFLHLGEENVLIEYGVGPNASADPGELAIDAIGIDVRGPGSRHHLPKPLAARAVQRAVLRREEALAGARLALGQPARHVSEAIDQADTHATVFPSPACGPGWAAVSSCGRSP